MKHLKTFEELKPSTYRTLIDQTADYPWSEYSSKSPKSIKKSKKMGNINKLSKERFEQEFYGRFPKGKKIKVYDSKVPTKFTELIFNEILWKANWSNFDLDFVQKNSTYYRGNADVHIKFFGDSNIPYTMDRGERIGFSGDILLEKESEKIVRSMFNFGKKEIEIEKEKEIELEEKPKGFISKVKNFFK